MEGLQLLRYLEDLLGKSQLFALCLCLGSIAAVGGLIRVWWLRRQRMPITNGTANTCVIGVLWAILGLLGLLLSLLPETDTAKENKAIDAIKQAGGTITLDKNLPDNPVVRVDLDSFSRRPSSLESLRPHLENLPQLRYLRITGSSGMLRSDALRHLEGLTQLETIDLESGWKPLGGGEPLDKESIARLHQKLPNVKILASTLHRPN
jgi:hypothetical protein